MAGKQLKASIIVDLMGNVSKQARLWSQNLSNMGNRGELAVRGMGSSVRGLGEGLGQLGQQSTRSVGMLGAGLRTVANGFDTLQARARAAYGGISRLYGLLAGGAAVYSANRWFIGPASRFENNAIALSSQYGGDPARVKETLDWAVKNARESTWGLEGVMQEYTSSMGFGMKDPEIRQFITLLEDQGAYRGWDLSNTQGASLQLKQMYSRQRIQAVDANILSGYGINAYQLLADKTGIDINKIREEGEKGLLGPKFIQLFFQILSEQAAGAQKNAMNSWTGLTAQMGDAWQEFARRVMDRGPFKLLKGQLRDFLNAYAAADESGVLDRYATVTANAFTGVFDHARQGVALFHQGLAKVQATLAQLHQAGYGEVINNIADGALTAGKAILALYAAQKIIRIGGALGGALLRPAWRIATAPVRYPYRWYKQSRNKKNSPSDTPRGRSPLSPFAFPGLSFPEMMKVFVTNWPGNMNGSTGGIHTIAKGRRKRGAGKGRTRATRVTPPLPLPPSALTTPTQGLLSRLWCGTGLGRLGRASRQAFMGLTHLSRTGLGRVGGWLGGASRSALSASGRWLGRLGGPALAALSVAPILLDETATRREKSEVVGSVAGGTLGGAVGSLAGPIGTVAGMALGSYLGQNLGSWLDEVATRWRNDTPLTQPPPKAEASVRLIAPDGWKMHSSEIAERGLGLEVDFYSGDNFYAY